jgi:hypothetical protein
VTERISSDERMSAGKATNLGLGAKVARYGRGRFATSTGLSFDLRFWRVYVFIDLGVTKRDVLAAAGVAAGAPEGDAA